eukprot:5238004-Pyramimonas_sp.AAC.1
MQVQSRKPYCSEDMVVAVMLQTIAMQGSTATTSMPQTIGYGDMGPGAYGRAWVGQFDGARRGDDSAACVSALVDATGREIAR